MESQTKGRREPGAVRRFMYEWSPKSGWNGLYPQPGALDRGGILIRLSYRNVVGVRCMYMSVAAAGRVWRNYCQSKQCVSPGQR